jgi:D-alanyl-D-alanine carboxypeptidase/D-alanyl-D-alanine-endopeptidase (penicillin-binding protein 4)
VEVEPELPIFSVRNVALTTDSRRRHTVAIARAPDRNELRVSGSVWRRAKPLEAWVAVADPAEYFGAALRDALEQEGIRVLGVAETARHLPTGGWHLAAVHRTDLQTSLEVTNKRSQNFYAESLFKLLGAVLCGDGSWSGGTRAVGQFLDRVGLGVGSYRIADGSGMSRNNRFSARQITRLLEFMFRHPWGREFVLSLAFSGEDNGRWERRLATPPYLGNVFAKTGTLNGVSSLSGYAKGRSGKVYAFSILCNGTKGAWHAQRSQDAIVRAIIDHG